MSEVSNTPVEVAGERPSSNRFALIALTSLFFMWGFITCLNDILIPYLKSAFDLSYTEAILIQFCFFSAYFVVSMPAGKLVHLIGYQRGIVAGLGVASLGCLLFLPAADMASYPVFLIALFVLASGITILQVSANPFVTAIGPEATASSRLTMTQAFNSLGTTVAPWIGAVLILSAAASASAEGVKMPYLGLSLALAGLAAIFYFIKLPKITAIESTDTPHESAWKQPHLVLGAVGIFVYVGAEVAIGSFLVNYLALENIGGLEESHAAKYIAYYWGAAMVGRFIGAAVMQKVAAGKALAFNATMAAALVGISMSTEGSVAMWTILGVGFFNSIMYPAIFSLAVKGLGAATSQGSGILCSAIVGGAIIPLFHGMLADSIGLQLAFALPLVCYAYIFYYGLFGSKASGQTQA